MKPGKYKTTFLGTEIPVLYVTDRAEAEELAGRLVAQFDSGETGLAAIDTETEALPEYRSKTQSALSPHLSKVRLIQIFTGRSAIVFDCKHIGENRLFTELLERGRWVGHNSVFDLQYFYKWFGVKSCNIGCTMLCAKLLFHAKCPTDTGLSASLRNLVNVVFKQEILKEMQTSDWSMPELTWEQVEYSALDAITTYFLAEKLAPQIVSYGLQRIYKLYKDAQHPICKMQLNGLKLDCDKHRDMIVGWRDEMYRAKKELTAITGISRITPHTLAKYLEGALPKDVLDIWPRTEEGKLETNAHVFADFDYLDIVKPFLEFQKREKLCTAFGNKLIEQVNPATGRLHAGYKLAGARTGRLSCATPNLQQLPRDKSVRSNFIPERDSVFICADYSQIEIRVGAELSRDPTMLAAYKDGKDLHAITAKAVSHLSDKEWEALPEAERKAKRQAGKSFNFGLMFGLGANSYKHYAKKSYGVDVTEEEADQGVKAWRKLYSTYRKWHMERVKESESQGYVTTPCGKRRCLAPEDCWGASANTPIQGGACECMLHSIVDIQKAIDVSNFPYKIVNCVHDEVLVEVPKDRVEHAKKMIEYSMQYGFLEVFPNGITRGIVDAHSGPSWGEAKG